jgi:hypothetical protein
MSESILWLTCQKEIASTALQHSLEGLMQDQRTQVRTYQATIPVDRLENRVLNYLQKQGSVGERLDIRTIRDLFSVARQEIRINLTPLKEEKTI